MHELDGGRALGREPERDDRDGGRAEAVQALQRLRRGRREIASVERIPHRVRDAGEEAVRQRPAHGGLDALPPRDLAPFRERGHERRVGAAERLVDGRLAVEPGAGVEPGRDRADAEHGRHVVAGAQDVLDRRLDVRRAGERPEALHVASPPRAGPASADRPEQDRPRGERGSGRRGRRRRERRRDQVRLRRRRGVQLDAHGPVGDDDVRGPRGAGPARLRRARPGTRARRTASCRRASRRRPATSRTPPCPPGRTPTSRRPSSRGRETRRTRRARRSRRGPMRGRSRACPPVAVNRPVFRSPSRTSPVTTT